MGVDQMRYALKNDSKYKSDKWSYKVDRMSDKQVIAVYSRLLATKQLTFCSK